MSVFAEALIFLSIAILTIIIAIFVLAVSFLARAIEISQQEEESFSKAKIIELTDSINSVKQKIGTHSVEDTGKLQKELQNLEKGLKDYDKKRKK